MAVVQGLVEGHILPGGNDGRVFLMTASAGLGAAILVRGGQFAMAGHAVDMVNVGHCLPVRIGQALVLMRQAPFFVSQVTGAAVPADLGQGFGVTAVKIGHRRPLQRSHGLHGVDYDQARTGFNGALFQRVDTGRPHGKHNNQYQGQQHATCFQMSCSFPHR